MRRSAAPSQLGLANKRPRFAPPFAASKTTNQTHSGETKSANQEGSGTKRDVLNLIQTNSSNEPYSGPSKVASLSNSTNRTLACQNTFRTPYSSKTQNAQAGDANKEDILQVNSEGARCDNNPLGSGSTGSTILKNETTSSVSVGGKLEQTADLSNNIPIVRKKAGLHRSSFRQPMLQKSSAENSPVTNSKLDNSEDDAVKSQYFNVVWCKLSKKKHKKWEGDAVLITKTRSVTLLDMEGKEIGKGRGYKMKDLETLSEGQTLFVGGKEIEVMGKIPEAEFTSGQCFQGAAVSTTAQSVSVASVSRPSSSKPFLNPLKGGNQAREKMFSERPLAKPLFDPSAPDALVMSQPNSTHQWDNNTTMQTIVDVVIDPYLASKLRPHQREGVRFLYECVMGMRAFHGNGAILADDMGLGKTLQCITLIWTLYKQGPYGGRPQVKRVIVITPGSLVKNWCREFRKWLGNERIRAFDVGSDKKVEEFAKSPIYPVMVISYEMLVRSIEEVQKIKFDLVICDEGHRLKNTNIKTTSLIMSLPCRKRILLTGTPVQNDLQEFFSIVEFCNPGVLGTSGAFHRVYEDPILKSRQPGATQEERTLGETRATELSRLTSLFVLRRTQEINNKYLPPKVETVVFCQPSDLQLALYRKLLASRVIRRCLTSSYHKEVSPHLVCIAALKKLCNHPCLIHKACVDADEESVGNKTEEEIDKKRWRDTYDDEEVSLYTGLLPMYPSNFSRDSPSVDHSGKLQVLSNLLKGLHGGDAKEKIVLVSNYTQTLDVLQKLCDRDGYEFCRLDGSIPTSKRQNIVEQFNSKYAQQTVFLLSSKAGGVGLNLIGASRLVLYDIDWNPANDLQAMARVWRDGQKKTVYIYRLITAGTLEEKVYQRQISKQGLSGAVLDAKIESQGNVKFSLEDLRDLFTLHEGAQCITHDMLDCDCNKDYTNAQPVAQTAQLVTQSRSCQLGQKRPQKAKKNLSMDELMGWKHFAGPLNDDFKDIHLKRAKDSITYVFQNVTNLT